MKIGWDQSPKDSELAAGWTGMDDTGYGATMGRAECKR